jgi:hypothetical protein
MIRLSNCPTLMDSCLNVLVLNAPSLSELTLEECPSILNPRLISSTLVRLKISSCFSLRNIDVSECPRLTILNLPWTVHLKQASSIFTNYSLKFISLESAAGLQSLELDHIPPGLSGLDLGWCTRLKTLSLRGCRNLVYLNVSCCISLEKITLINVHRLEQLDLTLLTKLKYVQLYEDFSLRKLLVFGCDKLEPENVLRHSSF